MNLSIHVAVDAETVVKMALRANELLIEFTQSIF